MDVPRQHRDAACDRSNCRYASSRQIIIPERWAAGAYRAFLFRCYREATMCALEGPRDALRRRDVYVTPSERYADARASLLSDAAWNASREDTQRSLSLPAQPGPFLQQLGGELDAAYQRTRDGLTRSIRSPSSPAAARQAARRPPSARSSRRW
jgi:hypothetical protein